MNINNAITKTEITRPIDIVGDSYELRLADLSTPKRVQQLVIDIKSINPRKQKININDLLVFIPEQCQREAVIARLSEALLSSSDVEARGLWEVLAVDIRYSILIPDEGLLNIDIVRKLDIEGGVIRNAYLSIVSIAPPDKTPYAYIYGSTEPSDAIALTAILEQIRKLKPEGQMLIKEFFEEIDIRVLYLFAMNEAEAYAESDPDGGAYLQLAMEADDKIPEQLVLTAWIQSYVPETFAELRASLLDHIWQENRSLFWKGWIRQNRPTVDEDYYDGKGQSKFASSAVGTGVSDEEVLDDLLKRCENGD